MWGHRDGGLRHGAERSRCAVLLLRNFQIHKTFWDKNLLFRQMTCGSSIGRFFDCEMQTHFMILD